MNALRHLVASLLVLALPAAAAADDALMKEVDAIGDALAKALIANDVDTMLGMYAEDAISLPNFSPRMDGVEAMRQNQEQATAAGMKVHSFTSDPTDVWECGNQVIEIGTYAISLTPPGMPGPIEDKGKYMTVYVRETDGALKIKAETWNTDVDPAAMASASTGHHDH